VYANDPNTNWFWQIEKDTEWYVLPNGRKEQPWGDSSRLRLREAIFNGTLVRRVVKAAE
jgi:hypothetical protein